MARKNGSKELSYEKKQTTIDMAAAGTTYVHTFRHNDILRSTISKVVGKIVMNLSFYKNREQRE